MPEYVYLLCENEDFSAGGGSRASILDSARWDTLQPKIYCLAATADGRYEPHYCYIYEVMFDTEHTVDGCFAIADSCNSNQRPQGYTYCWKYFPTTYLTFGNMNENPGLRINSHFYDHPLDSSLTIWPCGDDDPYLTVFGYGPFAAITDPIQVDLASNCTFCGTVEGMGLYPVGTTLSVRALPNTGYHFSHWSDGDNSNPRTLVLTENTSLTAHFEKGDLSISNTEQTASFTLHPNPSHGTTVVTLSVPEPSTLRIHDAAGKELFSRPVTTTDHRIELDLRNLPAGSYLITLSTPTVSSTQRLVIE